MHRYILILMILLTATLLTANDIYGLPGLQMVENYGFSSEIFSPLDNTRSHNIPDSILVFLVEFSDVKFDTIPDFPDNIAHDRAYFHRLMFHLSSYWSDASHGDYKIVSDSDTLYNIWQETFTLPNPMSYYGEESEKGDQIERKVEMITDLLDLADDQIDFNNYDSFMLFHAGAGQEAHNDNGDLIQSTFLSRKSFQAALDPENDDFPGIYTDDGTLFREITIFPESENMADIEEGEPIYGLLGIIAQGFGYQIGLPTLFDNVSSNGSSFGISRFGVMGYGVWNAAGYVPPLPCAWSRYFLGWEDDNLIEVTTDSEMLEVVYPQFNGESSYKLYKVPISDKEYFLLENRQQNPDNSYFVNAQNDTLVTFTFATIADQDVYPPDHEFAGQPKFNFMTNSYEDCEWDFYLPGYGDGDDPDNDGSGILIWHIDENVIEENFSEDFSNNSVNGDASHKGVDLEEADGVQHLDSFNEFGLGTKDDSYREGNNSYFGKMYPEPGLLSLPTSESYYGGSQLEIYDIGVSDSVMTFSVRFSWYLDTNFTGENPFNAAIVNFDGDDDLEIFYPMPDGSIYLWKNYVLQEDYPIYLDPLAAYYAYDEFSGTFLIPTANTDPLVSRLGILQHDQMEFPFYPNLVWAGNPLVNTDEENLYRVFLPFNLQDGSAAQITMLNSFYEEAEILNFNGRSIASNLILSNNLLYSILQNEQSEFYLNRTDLEDLQNNSLELSGLWGDVSITASIMADIDSDLQNELILTTADTLLYVFDLNGEAADGFPVKIPLKSISLPAIGDIDQNGFFDIIIGGINSFVTVNKNGEISQPDKEIDSPDSLYSAAGMIALDLDGNGELELMGNMSRNRLSAWENLNNNTFRMIHGYPVSFGDYSSCYPIPVATGDNSSIIYYAGYNGTMYKQEIDSIFEPSVWMTEYADLQRTACYNGNLPINQFETDRVFIKDQTYIYPNPLSRIFSKSIFKGNSRENTLTIKIMTGRDGNVKCKIFDIAGNLIFSDTKYCEAYIDNSICIDAEKLASGVYFANLYSRNKTMKLKFAIEK